MPTDAEGATGPMMGGGHGGEPGSTLPGLALAQDGYRLVPEVTTLAPGPAQPYRFHILGPDGKPVKRYDQLHERELHLIVVRRDMTGFQHVHPTRAPDGTWAIPLDLRTGGSWRVFADFQPTGGPGELTLGFDLHVPGTFEVGPRPSAAEPPDPRFDVKFARSGMDLTVSVRRDGKPVEPEPYLGAKGHLVALRVGDLAYNHVHPMPAPGPAVHFMVMLPTPGTYGLFFSYQVDGVVHTGVTSVKEA